MSDQNVLGIGGPPYKPSARKSIHNHENCIFAECKPIMGRYGLKKKCEGQSRESSSQDQGVDEIDNIMSKFAHQSSPLLLSKNKRSNSLGAPDKDNFENDSDSDLLAKSLPANMPSCYYSDGFAHQSLPDDFDEVNNDSFSSTKATNRSKNHSYNSYEKRKLLPRKELSFKEHTKSSNIKCTKVLFATICGLISLVTAVLYGPLLKITQGKVDINVFDESKFNQEIGELREKYQISEHSLLELQTGLSTISKRNDTGSFIFVYNERLVKFDEKQFNNFIEDIAITAAKYLRNSSRNALPTIVQSSKFNMKTHSELMNTYKQEVARTGVMLVKDIDMIPSNLAMAFHYFCDEYNPLVSKAAIFFTLNLERCADSRKTTYVNIEKCLTDKWNTIPKDNIKPLLARVVNVIIDLNDIS